MCKLDLVEGKVPERWKTSIVDEAGSRASRGSHPGQDICGKMLQIKKTKAPSPRHRCVNSEKVGTLVGDDRCWIRERGPKRPETDTKSECSNG